ncbi:MAG: hypothetical protein VW337_08605, partial [Gammaproteobacteria bacterium]
MFIHLCPLKRCLATSLLLLFSVQLFGQSVPQLIEQYCIKCHNFEDWAGSLDLEGLDFDHVEQDPKTWELLIRKVRIGMMPPVGEDRPAKEALEGLAHAIADQLDSKITVIPAAPSLH